MARIPYDPKMLDAVAFAGPDGTKHTGRRYEVLRKSADGGRSPIPLAGDWLAAFQMLRNHPYFRHFHDYHLLGLTMDQIAAEAGTTKFTVSRRIARLRADILRNWPDLNF